MTTPSLPDLKRQELPGLYSELNLLLKKFKMKTGANDSYIYMILGALSNEYKKKAVQLDEKTWKKG